MKKKITNQDLKDWKKFLESSSPLEKKDVDTHIKSVNEITFDLHGYSLEEANKKIENLVTDCYNKKICKIKVITGKGLRSRNKENPYVSNELSILKNSVPDFLKTSPHLMKMIVKINQFDDKKGNSGFFEIILKTIR